MTQNIHIQYSLESNELKNVQDGDYPIKGVIITKSNNDNKYNEKSYITSKKVKVRGQLISIHTLEAAFKEFLEKSIEMDKDNFRSCFYMERCEFDNETATISVDWGT